MKLSKKIKFNGIPSFDSSINKTLSASHTMEVKLLGLNTSHESEIKSLFIECSYSCSLKVYHGIIPKAKASLDKKIEKYHESALSRVNLRTKGSLVASLELIVRR